VNGTAQTYGADQAVREGSGLRWAQLLILLSLTFWLYFPVLSRLAGQWQSDPNFSHGFFVPLFALFVLWDTRHRIAAVPTRPSWSGTLLLMFGLLLLILGTLGAELFLSRTSFLVVIAGIIVLLWGWKVFKAMLFPWAFLTLMIPIPAIIFNQLTFPLQIFASKIAGWSLPLMGVPVLREGNVIQLPAMTLEVAEACSGIRSLLSLVTLAVIYGYLVTDSNRMRILLAVSAIPIAVAANSLRIVGTGLLVQYWDPAKAEGFFHSFSGWLIFVVSLGMLFLLHKVLEKILPHSTKE